MVKLIVKIQKKVFYSDMANNRLIEWFYFWLNIDFGVRDIKPVTEPFGPSSYLLFSVFEPSHEIMARFVLRKLILQTRMRRHPMGLDV